MSDTPNIPKQLRAPFAPSVVSFRVGPTTKDKTKGMALAYIDARDVMRRLDKVCGPENWQDEYPWSDGKRVVCRIGIKIGYTQSGQFPDEWVWKSDGAGDTDTEGEKGALSDAFKRAAVKWGIGRYLYDLDPPWVEIEQKGSSYIIKQSELAKLRAGLPAPQGAPVTPAPPQGYGEPSDHPRRQEALDAYAILRKAIEGAETLRKLDDLVTFNKNSLELIKQVHEDSYYRLLQMATAKRQEFLSGA